MAEPFLVRSGLLARTPRGESSQWGDYHLREVALYVRRLATNAPYLTFFGPVSAKGRA